jgi:hypothetical protein
LPVPRSACIREGNRVSYIIGAFPSLEALFTLPSRRRGPLHLEPYGTNGTQGQGSQLEKWEPSS